MVDVILADNSRPACGGPWLIRYSAAGVFLAIAQKGLNVRWVDLSDKEGNVAAQPAGTVADVCCYAVFFGNKTNAFRHMRELRRNRKAPRLIIAFGPFASVFPEEIISKGLADIVVSSDPEFVIPVLLHKTDDLTCLQTISGLSYKHEGKIVHTRRASFPDLDQIPFIGPYLYKQGHRPALMMTARGCQYHCVYCDRNVLWGGGVRNRSVANVLKEVRELAEDCQVDEIRFLDEDLAADRRRLATLCQGMRRIKGDFSWQCSACVDSVNQEILLLMGRSRCREIYFGVESASPQVLRKIGKKYGRREILNAVRWSKQAGLEVTVMITVGNPGETESDRRQTLSVLNELSSQATITTNRLVILPGTPLYRKGLREGWFTPKSFFEDEGIIFYDEKARGAGRDLTDEEGLCLTRKI